MEKSGYGAAPPAYSDIMQSSSGAPPAVHHTTIQPINPYNVDPSGPYQGGIAVTTSTSGFVPPPGPGFVVNQPIAAQAPINYGTMNSPPIPNYQPPGPDYVTQTIIVGVPADIRQVGGCPVCRIGVLEDNFPLLGVCCAIAFFPLGILCCLAMRNKRCSHCGIEYDP